MRTIVGCQHFAGVLVMNGSGEEVSPRPRTTSPFSSSILPEVYLLSNFHARTLQWFKEKKVRRWEVKAGWSLKTVSTRENPFQRVWTSEGA